MGRTVVTEVKLVVNYKNKTKAQLIEELEKLGQRIDELEAAHTAETSERSALGDREKLHRTLIETMNDGIGVTDRNGRLTYINTRMGEMIGYRPEEVIGRSIMDFLDDENRQILEAQVADRQEGIQASYELCWLKKDGGRVFAIVSPQGVLDEDGNYIGSFAVITDITERKRAEEALRESEKKFRSIFESIVDGFYRTDMEGNLTLFSPSALRIVGYDNTDDTLGLNIVETFYYHPEDRVTFLRELQKQGSVLDFEIVLRRRDGTPISVETNSHLIFDEQRKPIGVEGVFRDITKRKQAEQERAALEEQLQQAQKMEAIGRLAGGIAHDMNNVLGAIMGSASALSLDIATDTTMAEDVSNILNACRRGSRLTRDLLGFARKGKYVKERISLNNAVTRVEDLLRRTISKKIEIVTILETRLRDIEGDLGQIENALMNVCINAADAIEEHGKLIIKTKQIDLKGPPSDSLSDLTPGIYVQLQIADTGTGMNPETRAKAFEPFFTTKPQGKGTGLGLSMVYGVTKNHGGGITLESAIGRGTVVTILLPAIERTQEATRRETKNQTHYLTRGHGSILLVDDEQTIIQSTQSMLEKLGYQVITSHDGREALTLYKEQREKVDLIILDLAMPELDGSEMFKKLMEIDPSARVLLSSGYSRDKNVESLLADGARGFVQKPFDIAKLSSELERALR